MMYKLYLTDEDGGKHYIVDGDINHIVNEENEEFKEWVAEGNTPQAAD